MKIQCAIFDFDGTLFDSMYVWRTAGETYFRSVGIEPKPSLWESVKSLSSLQAAYFLKEDYALEQSVEEIVAGIAQMVEQAYFYDVQPKPDVVPFLDEMQRAGIQMCIATASESYQIEAALKRCGMDHFFAAVFSCTEVGYGKDEPIIFREAMEYFGADRSNTVIFEDAVHAVETAKDDGFTVVVVYDEYEDEQEKIRQLADLYLEDFANTEPFWAFVSAD
ncbi:MAG TPA: HAD family phosphatase [Clostridiaceae bacterium]|jgi:HAD superfamily hydrolase (TIGR01509 family)|nr:HAD family phosphatase [Clostridiaceae bacterium]